jgi:hypothetical protein
VAVQTFYEEKDCAGPTYAIFKYPVQEECLRASNGTQTITAPSDSNITLTDFVGSSTCGKTDQPAQEKKYFITGGYCYPLYPTKAPKSFKWTILRTVKTVVSSARRGTPVLLSALLVLSARLLSLGHV